MDLKINRNQKWILSLLIISLPLMWLNVKDSHDWGDDFASYLHQTQNIYEGKTQGDTGYLINPRFVFMGPPAYTVGFPLLLTPLYAMFGHDMHVYLIFMSCILVLFLVMMFVFLASRMKPLYAFIFCLIIGYNPVTLYLKAEIMCDICLALFILLNLLFFEKWKLKDNVTYALILALLNGWLLSLKVSGAVVSMGLLVMLMFTIIQHRYSPKRQKIYVRNTFIIILGGVGFYLFLNEIVFPVPQGGFSFYASISQSKNYCDTILSNLDNYINQFNIFFAPETEKWDALAKITAAIMLSFTVIGYIIKISEKVELADLIPLFYLGVLLIYPYQAGPRFVFPLLPFACYYIYITTKQVASNFKHHNMIAIAVAIVVLLQVRTGIEKIVENRFQIVDGPQRIAAREAFSYIKSYIPQNAIFDFRRPRALAFYTQRRACCSFVWDTPVEVLRTIDSLQVNYCMLNNNDPNKALDSLIKIKPELFNKLWNNDQFIIYKFR